MSDIQCAYSELVEDTATLWDPNDDGPRSAVTVILERRDDGRFEIDVSLSQIEGGQLSFVLSVARKWELEVREEKGWLVLQPHLTDADPGDGEPVEEGTALEPE